jgi:hypothetical protein
MRFSNIINVLGRAFFVFIIAYLWAGYYIRSFFTSMIIAVAFAIFVEVVFYSLRNQKSARLNISRECARKMNLILLQLRFMSNIAVLQLFYKALAKKFACTLTSRKLSLATPSGNLEIFSLFHCDPTPADIIKCVNNTKEGSKTLIAATAFSPEVIAFVSSLRIQVELLNKEVVYNQILAPSEVFPEITVEFIEKRKMTLRRLRSIVLSRHRTRGYILTAVFIIFTGFLIQLPIYYIIVATIVFGLGFVSRLQPLGNKNLFE